MLEWHNDQAFNNGRLVFEVAREKSGWKLYRFRTRLNGETVFHSKEKVKSRKDGIDYAESLMRPLPKAGDPGPQLLAELLPKFKK